MVYGLSCICMYTFFKNETPTLLIQPTPVIHCYQKLHPLMLEYHINLIKYQLSLLSAMCGHKSTSLYLFVQKYHLFTISL